MNYYEVKIYTSTEGLEAVAAVLVMLGHETFITEDKTIVDELLAKENSYDWDYVDDSVIAQRDNETNITVYMDPDDEDTVPGIKAIKESIAMLKEQDVNGVFGRLDVEDILVCDDDWKDNWKEFFKPAKITDTIVIKPTWEEYEPAEGERIIEIDPGMAFGTGTHPTTKMCVQHMEKYIDSEDDLVLDLGCGSGILSIAAALCGSKNIKGVDIDPNAVEASFENVEKNGMSDVIEISWGDVTQGLGFKADIIVANLMADLIMMLSDDIAKHLKGKKIFISSGILVEKRDQVAEVIRNSGFEIIEILEEDEWCAIAARLK